MKVSSRNCKFVSECAQSSSEMLHRGKERQKSLRKEFLLSFEAGLGVRLLCCTGAQGSSWMEGVRMAGAVQEDEAGREIPLTAHLDKAGLSLPQSFPR